MGVPFSVFGALSVAMMLMSRGVYITSIIRGVTRPHVFSWFIWGVISSIGFAAQVTQHAGAGSWARGVGALLCFAIVALSVRHGERHVTRGDWVTLGIALAAIPLWVLTKTPVWSVVLVCLIDTAGYIPTLRKAWHKPAQETPRGYMFSSLGAFFSLLAIEHYELSTWLYPAVLVASNGGMALLIWSRRRRLNNAGAEQAAE